MHILRQTKAFFALCWQNIKNGYELHNAKRKKYISGNGAPTIIDGTSNAVHIFEGFFNFLSALEYYRTTKPAGTCIILNSVTNLEQIIHTLEQYQKINLYLDNDPPGEQAAETIKNRYPNVNDYSKIIYPEINDFNDFLCNQTTK